MCPGFAGVGLLDYWSGYVFGLEFVLDGAEHGEGGVAALAVVEDLGVVEDRVGQFQAGSPSLAVEQFGLHAAPERLDHRIVVAVADRSHRGQQSRCAGAVGEGPRGELTP
jgi:hypothetical protein